MGTIVSIHSIPKSILIQQSHDQTQYKLNGERYLIHSTLLGSSSTLQAFSSLPSAQSGFWSQKNAFEIHSPSPHCRLPSGHTGSSVFRLGLTSLGLDRRSQLSTYSKITWWFICFSISLPLLSSHKSVSPNQRPAQRGTWQRPVWWFLRYRPCHISQHPCSLPR